MILWPTCEVLEAELVLDGQKQNTAWFEQGVRTAQSCRHWILPCLSRKILACIFEDADQCHNIKKFFSLKSIEVVAHDGDIVKTIASSSSNFGPNTASLERQDIRTQLPKCPRYGATATTDL